MNYSVNIFIVLIANIRNHFSDDLVALTINKIIPKLVSNQNKKMSKLCLTGAERSAGLRPRRMI